MYDYVIMAFRMYLGEIDYELEDKLYATIHYLMDIYTEKEIHNLLLMNKIVN